MISLSNGRMGIVGEEISFGASFPAEMAEELWGWLNSPRSDNFPDNVLTTFDEFLAELCFRESRGATWSIQIDDLVIGYIGFSQQSNIYVQMQGIVLDPEYRGKGYGKRAIMALMQILQEIGCKTVMAQLFYDNQRIRHILMNCGFYETGAVPHAAERNGEPLAMRIMTKHLLEGVD